MLICLKVSECFMCWITCLMCSLLCMCSKHVHFLCVWRHVCACKTMFVHLIVVKWSLITFWSSEAGCSLLAPNQLLSPHLSYFTARLEPDPSLKPLWWALLVVIVNNDQDIAVTSISPIALCLVSLQGKRNKPGVEAASSPDSVRGRGENKAIK